MSQQETQISSTLRDHLAGFHPESSQYLHAHNVRFGSKKMNTATSAIWTFGSKVVLNSHYFAEGFDLSDPWLLSILAHEIRHLQQGPVLAFSVYGELDAWQLGFRLYYQKVEKPYPEVLAELMALPLVMERQILEEARRLMTTYAGKKYRIDLYPLFPFPKEIKYYFREKLLGQPGKY